MIAAEQQHSPIFLMGHVTYVISHPRRYMGKNNDYGVCENIFLTEKDEEEKKWNDTLTAFRRAAQSRDDNWWNYG